MDFFFSGDLNINSQRALSSIKCVRFVTTSVTSRTMIMCMQHQGRSSISSFALLFQSNLLQAQRQPRCIIVHASGCETTNIIPASRRRSVYSETYRSDRRDVRYNMWPWSSSPYSNTSAGCVHDQRLNT